MYPGGGITFSSVLPFRFPRMHLSLFSTPSRESQVVEKLRTGHSHTVCELLPSQIARMVIKPQQGPPCGRASITGWLPPPNL